MSRKGGKVVGIGLRRPEPVVSEEAIQALESKAESLGTGVAGQAEVEEPLQEQPETPEPEAPPVEPGTPAGSRGIIQRKGRLRADGSRTQARTLRRLTVYLDPAMAKAIERRAVETGLNKSEMAQAAFAAWLEQQ